MDFNKLMHVTDGFTNPSRQTATAPKSKPKNGSVLDNMEVRAKIADTSTEPKVKMMILDDAQIKTIMGLPREERRKFLSRLTDSQRRRFLARHRELSKVKDDESVSKLNFVNLDSILNNIVYCPDDYHLQLLEQWESAYQVPSEIQAFVDAAKGNDRQGLADNLDAYISWCKSVGINTDINLAEDVIEGKGAEASEEPVEEPTEESIEQLPPMEDMTEEGTDEGVVPPLPEERTEDAVRADLIAFAQKAKMQIKDEEKSARIAELESLLAQRRVMDTVIDEIASKPLLDPYTGEEVQEEDEQPILEALSQALEAYVNGDSTLLDQIATTTMGGDSTEEPETEEEADLQEENEDLEETVEDETGMDADDAVDENQEEEAEESEHNDFHVGDSSPIEVQCPIEKAEEADKEEIKSDSELAKELAQLLKMIEKGTENGEIKDSLNSHISALESKVPALRKYNFKVNDDAPVICTCEAPVNSINPPLSRSEYYDMCPVCPDYFDLVCASYPSQLCPNCNEYQVNPNGLCVNPSTCPQTYYPYNCTLQEIADLLGAAEPTNYTNVINEHCCPMSDALHLAALTNNLGFIDNTFYKKRVGDSGWVFDSVPECLKAYTDKAGSIKQVAKATDSSIKLFGVDFELN